MRCGYEIGENRKPPELKGTCSKVLKDGKCVVVEDLNAKVCLECYRDIWKGKK